MAAEPAKYCRSAGRPSQAAGECYPSAMQTDPVTTLSDLNASRFRMLAQRALDKPAASWDQAAPRANIAPPSDFDLNPDAVAEWHGHVKPRAAAVLVPVIARVPLTLLFTQRTEHLAAHAGQIAFPGGKADPRDESPLATALREAAEEIGLDQHWAEPLGQLDRYRTGTGFEITPIIALIDPAFLPVADPHEVAEVFEVPLSYLMNPENHQRHSRDIAGRERHFYAMPYRERYIWGATAGIVRNMHQRLFAQ